MIVFPNPPTTPATQQTSSGEYPIAVTDLSTAAQTAALLAAFQPFFREPLVAQVANPPFNPINYNGDTRQVNVILDSSRLGLGCNVGQFLAIMFSPENGNGNGTIYPGVRNAAEAFVPATDPNDLLDNPHMCWFPNVTNLPTPAPANN